MCRVCLICGVAVLYFDYCSDGGNQSVTPILRSDAQGGAHEATGSSSPRTSSLLLLFFLIVFCCIAPLASTLLSLVSRFFSPPSTHTSSISNYRGALTLEPCPDWIACSFPAPKALSNAYIACITGLRRRCRWCSVMYSAACRNSLAEKLDPLSVRELHVP